MTENSVGETRRRRDTTSPQNQGENNVLGRTCGAWGLPGVRMLGVTLETLTPHQSYNETCTLVLISDLGHLESRGEGPSRRGSRVCSLKPRQRVHSISVQHTLPPINHIVYSIESV